MVELKVPRTVEQTLESCRTKGLVVRIQRGLAEHPGGRHWHLGIPGRAGTLEISAWDGEVWVKVHPLRDGGWAGNVARELAAVGTDVT